MANITSKYPFSSFLKTIISNIVKEPIDSQSSASSASSFTKTLQIVNQVYNKFVHSIPLDSKYRDSPESYSYIENASEVVNSRKFSEVAGVDTFCNIISVLQCLEIFDTVANENKSALGKAIDTQSEETIITLLETTDLRLNEHEIQESSLLERLAEKGYIKAFDLVMKDIKTYEVKEEEVQSVFGRYFPLLFKKPPENNLAKNILTVLCAHGNYLNAVQKSNALVVLIFTKNINKELITQLIVNGANPTQRADNSGWSAFSSAVSYRETKGLEFLIEAIKEKVKKDGGTDKQAEEALQQMINSTETSKGQKTLLIVASSMGFIDIVQILVANGADVMREDSEGNNAFQTALIFNKIKVVEILLESIKAKVKSGGGSDKEVKERFQEVINKQDKKGRTLLIRAAEKGNIEFIKLLIAHGADLMTEEPIRGTRWNVITAVPPEKDRTKVIPVITEAIKAKVKSDGGSDEKVKEKLQEVFGTGDFSGRTLLMFASEHEDIELVKILIANGADPLEEDSDGDNALHLAISNAENIDVVAALIGAIKEKVKSDGGTDEQAKKLLKNFVNMEDNDGDTPLECALSLESALSIKKIEIIKLLIANGANPTLKQAKNAIELAVKLNDIEAVKDLIEIIKAKVKSDGGTDEKARKTLQEIINSEGCLKANLLRLAAHNRNLPIARILAKYRPNPLLRDPTHEPALMCLLNKEVIPDEEKERELIPFIRLLLSIRNVVYPNELNPLYVGIERSIVDKTINFCKGNQTRRAYPIIKEFLETCLNSPATG